MHIKYIGGITLTLQSLTQCEPWFEKLLWVSILPFSYHLSSWILTVLNGLAGTAAAIRIQRLILSRFSSGEAAALIFPNNITATMIPSSCHSKILTTLYLFSFRSCYVTTCRLDVKQMRSNTNITPQGFRVHCSRKTTTAAYNVVIYYNWRPHAVECNRLEGEDAYDCNFQKQLLSLMFSEMTETYYDEIWDERLWQFVDVHDEHGKRQQLLRLGLASLIFSLCIVYL